MPSQKSRASHESSEHFSPDPQALAGKRVAFTGRLASMPRRKAYQWVREAGGEPVQGVSRRTHVLVVGMDGWPLLADGSISAKLKKAEALQASGHGIEILSEQGFLGRLQGRIETFDAIKQTCTVEQACGMLEVAPETLRRWEQFGLVRPQDGVLDFQDLVSLRVLTRLMRAGMTPAAIAQGLAQLARFLPEAERPLAQARFIADQGSLVMELAGVRIDTHGQLLLNFEWKEEAAPPLSLPESRGNGEAADAWVDYGFECEARREWLEAERAYRRALASQPDRAEAHFNLANVLHHQGKLEAAEGHYRRAVEHDPGLACAWYNLAYLLDEQGRLEEAVEVLRRALAIVPTYADAHYNLALCCERLGEVEQAAGHWQAYLRLNPVGEWAEIAHWYLATNHSQP